MPSHETNLRKLKDTLGNARKTPNSFVTIRSGGDGDIVVTLPPGHDPRQMRFPLHLLLEALDACTQGLLGRSLTQDEGRMYSGKLRTSIESLVIGPGSSGIAYISGRDRGRGRR